MSKYYLYNDVKWWFTDKNYFQARYELDHYFPVAGSGKNDTHRGFMRYTAQWLPWLQTVTGVSANFRWTDTSKVAQAGPDLNATINLQRFGIVRNLINNHSLNLEWVKENGEINSVPNLNYTLYFKVIILPNFSLTNSSTLALTELNSGTYSGTFTAMVLF